MCSQNTFNCLFAVMKYNRRFKNLAITYHYYAFSQPPIFPDITSLSRSEQLALLGFGSALLGSLLSLCRSASLGFAWLGSLGFTQLSLARLALLGSLGSHRFAQPRILARCSHHWLPSHSLRRLASALACIAWLASRAKRHLASLDLHRWLAWVVPGLLRLHR